VLRPIEQNGTLERRSVRSVSACRACPLTCNRRLSLTLPRPCGNSRVWLRCRVPAAWRCLPALADCRASLGCRPDCARGQRNRTVWDRSGSGAMFLSRLVLGASRQRSGLMPASSPWQFCFGPRCARRCRSSCMARGRFPSTPTLVVGIMGPQRHDGMRVIARLTPVLARAETTTCPVTTWQQTRPSVSLLCELSH
jgi:hypothetical protein